MTCDASFGTKLYRDPKENRALPGKTAREGRKDRQGLKANRDRREILVP